MNEIYSRSVFGIDFYDEDDKIVKEMSFGADEATRDTFFQRLEDEPDNDDIWPIDAVRVEDTRQSVMRAPIRGIDYGPGSQKRRFGGGHVPRSTYQTPKRNQ